MIDPAAENVRYPLTGRFLLGRLRDAMSDGEKVRLEAKVERTEWIEKSARLIARGALLWRKSRSARLV